ncbi:shikimate dehydrogenase [Phototrophicus methaneseepsis]|uniref:Shikimate dehydrogenase n=1 Tax=Phototrophicus methaneseepsis TaxID=2710758 RepID=A0A7S8IGS7_9CHLR|nr:shikimate dehydrogenase [Phototrophicus methaneseepsis]QPC85017.1 shikimate dehydrogenase [Phototrophicus methaneseepsis]
MMNDDVVKKEQPTFYFIGVTTGQSSINKVFPLWMDILEHPEVKLEGIDHAIHDAPENYRQSVAQIKYDPNSLGALVTTHKIDLYNATRDMFDYFDPYAQVTGEISCISKRAGALRGHAKDPITASLSLGAIIENGYFAKTGGHVLSLGAGGAAVATLLNLINKPDKSDRPAKFIAIDLSQERLNHMQQMATQYDTDIEIEYIQSSDPTRNDEIMASLPDASIVINATGMGKDTPGSPITDEGIFPRKGIAWEFNYRGERDFMHQALRQADSRELQVEDGWVYFTHGWSQVIIEVLDIQLTPEIFKKLVEVASVVRSESAQ